MTGSPQPVGERPQVPLLLGSVFLMYLGQMTLNPVIAPLAREVGLAEWQIGFITADPLDWFRDKLEVVLTGISHRLAPIS